MIKQQQLPPLAQPSKLKFLSRKEAARELRISTATLDRSIVSGALKAKKHGHFVFVMASEIERSIESWPDVKPRAERSAR